LVPRRKLYSFWIDEDQAKGLERVWTDHGVRASEQIRRAIDAWLLTYGIQTEAAKSRKTRAPRTRRTIRK
jgi:hypothetical protein